MGSSQVLVKLGGVQSADFLPWQLLNVPCSILEFQTLVSRSVAASATASDLRLPTEYSPVWISTGLANVRLSSLDVKVEKKSRISWS